MSSRLELRKAELWLQDFRSRPSWGLVASTLWVAYRDFEMLRRWLRDDTGGASLLPGAGEIIHAKTVSGFVAEDPRAAEPLPLEALLVALRSGTVASVGVATSPDTWNGQPFTDPTPQAIPQAAWHSHRLGRWYKLYFAWEVARISEEPFLLPREWEWRDELATPSRYWSAVQLDRASLLEAFPPKPEKKTSNAEHEAEKALRRVVEEHLKGQGSPPVGAAWRESALEDFSISIRGARRVWDKVAADHPFLSDPTNKPKRRRP